MMLRVFIFAAFASTFLVANACAETVGATPENVEVELVTALGTILVEVYPQAAPLSAGDFLRYVDEGLYDDAGFYRVVRLDNDNGSPVISVIQGGLLEERQALAPIDHETTEATRLRHVDGALSLARSDPGTGSAAAFFIVLGDQPSLDYGGGRNPDGQGFAVFGRVVDGMDVVRRINAMPADAPVEDEYVRGQILAEPVRFEARRKPAAIRGD